MRGALALLVFAALSVVWSSLALALPAPPHSLSHGTVGLFAGRDARSATHRRATHRHEHRRLSTAANGPVLNRPLRDA